MRTIFFLIIGCSLIQGVAAQNIITISNNRTVFIPADYSESVPEYFIPEGVTVALSSDSSLYYYINRNQFYNNTNVLQITNWSQVNNDAITQFKSDHSKYLNGNNSYQTPVVGPVYLKVLPQYAPTAGWKGAFVITIQSQSSIVDQANNTILNPNTAVVIPSTVNGDVEVVLEQSQDGVTWTQCLPGTYNASTVKRFFRLRAVEK